MKRINLLASALLLTATTAGASVSTEFLQSFENVHYQKIESEIVGRPYHIYTMLPDGYEKETERQYPTVYVLDGGKLFSLFTAYYSYLNFGMDVPDMIIVGISYGNDNFEDGNFRSTDFTASSTERDYWGGAGRFQQFLSDELLPTIEHTYRSRADRRIVFGQSIGGQFVLYTALTDPRLFWGHIASNPALHTNLPFFLESHSDIEPSDAQSLLFVGTGTNDDPMFRKPMLEWIDAWSCRENTPWQLSIMNLDGHNHMSAPPAAFRQGMRWLFSDKPNSRDRCAGP